MLKRLLALAAVIAAFFVFVPSASAQTPPALPTECLAGTLTPECRAALERLLRPADTVEDLLGNPAVLPRSCTRILDLDLDATLSGRQLFRVLQCLTDLTNLDAGEGDVGEPTAAAYDEGYGYDLGYDIAYDEGIPEGGVESGFGPTDSDASGAPLVARGGAVLAVLGVLASGLLIMRRRHGS